MAKILVVENNRGIREILRYFLTHHPKNRHKVTVVSTAKRAQERIRKSSPPFEMVITGNRLGHQNGGAELTRWLKENFPQTLIILMSGLRKPAYHQANIFIRKPFKLGRMQQAIKRLLAI